MEEAAKTFDKMGENGLKPNIVTWTTLISGYVHNGYWNEALKLFRELLKEDLRPNFVTISSVLPACSELAALFHGREHPDIEKIIGMLKTFTACMEVEGYVAERLSLLHDVEDEE
ncbi:hypothetical protein AMTR_s00029p00201320 [Amborella trichopoda]|uniref:Pentacotripeptide-repeat region of PRORP domain-containing protein n=1 Tax=Amborella trichopoda TaxID=13333 RepID=W1PI46_AMBTC|nr:hypothetical protein AMTR_s00029p00201320 [Amborella trichopoda]